MKANSHSFCSFRETVIVVFLVADEVGIVGEFRKIFLAADAVFEEGKSSAHQSDIFLYLFVQTAPVDIRYFRRGVGGFLSRIFLLTAFSIDLCGSSGLTCFNGFIMVDCHLSEFMPFDTIIMSEVKKKFIFSHVSSIHRFKPFVICHGLVINIGEIISVKVARFIRWFCFHFGRISFRGHKNGLTGGIRGFESPLEWPNL
ncbi:hypothetical protein TNCV_2775501 [Trichonephila clavipes]|nr:hypothetical protein TNCV_2775501 [Trichonephila clavipes]